MLLLLLFLFPYLCVTLLYLPSSPLLTPSPCHLPPPLVIGTSFCHCSVNHKSSTKRFWIRYLNNFIVTDNNEFKLFFILQSHTLSPALARHVFPFFARKHLRRMRAQSTAADARLWQTSANAYFSQRRSDPLGLMLCIYVFRYFCCCLRFTLLFWTLCSAFYFYLNVQLALFASVAHVHVHVCMCVCVRLYWFDGLESSNHPHSIHIHWFGGASLFFSSHSSAFLFFSSSVFQPHTVHVRIYVIFLCAFFLRFCLIQPYVGRITSFFVLNFFISLSQMEIFWQLKWIHLQQRRGQIFSPNNVIAKEKSSWPVNV